MGYAWGPRSLAGAPGLLYGGLVREANMLSFNDTFLTLSAIMIMLLPLVVFMKRLQV